MLELGAGAGLLRTFGWLLWGILAAALLAALIKPKTGTGKALCILLVLGIFFGPMLPSVYRAYEHKQRYAKAKVLFDERCKTAGEKIYRTVDNVEGVLLKKVRPDRSSATRSDPFWPDAALPDESGGDWYIISFLGWEQRQGSEPGSVNVVPTDFPGYKYVDVQREDKSLVRYTMIKDALGWGKLSETQSNGVKSRYGVDYVNDMNPDLRAQWIAGTRIIVSDLQTNEILAERKSFAFEPGLGSTVGFRSPWGFAIICPKAVSGSQTRNFVEKVIKLNQGK